MCLEDVTEKECAVEDDDTNNTGDEGKGTLPAVVVKVAHRTKSN
jgi:hypothetical protein